MISIQAKLKIIKFNGSKILKAWYNNANSKYFHVAILTLNKEKLKRFSANVNKIIKEFLENTKEINNDSYFLEFMNKEYRIIAYYTIIFIPKISNSKIIQAILSAVKVIFSLNL